MMCSSNIIQRDSYCFLSLLATVAAQTPAATMDVTPAATMDVTRDLSPSEIASWFASDDLREVLTKFDRARQVRDENCKRARALERWNEVVELLRVCHTDKGFVCGYFTEYINTFGVGGGCGNAQHIVAVGPTTAPGAFPGGSAPRGGGSEPASCRPGCSDGIPGQDAGEQARRWHPGNSLRVDPRCTSAGPAGLAGPELVAWVLLRLLADQRYATYRQVRTAFYEATGIEEQLGSAEFLKQQNNCFSRYWKSAVADHCRVTRSDLRISCVCPAGLNPEGIAGFPKNVELLCEGWVGGQHASQYFKARQRIRKGTRSKTPNRKRKQVEDEEDDADGQDANDAVDSSDEATAPPPPPATPPAVNSEQATAVVAPPPPATAPPPAPPATVAPPSVAEPSRSRSVASPPSVADEGAADEGNGSRDSVEGDGGPLPAAGRTGAVLVPGRPYFRAV